MINSHMMKKGTIIEFTQDIIDLFDKTNSIFKGEQFILQAKMSKQGGSALIACLKNLKTGSKHTIFWVFIKSRIRIISTIETKKACFSPSDISLNENEEYVIIHKYKPDIFYRTAFFQTYQTLKKDEFLEGSAIFTNKKGNRKKFKNIQSLNAFLNGIAGARNWIITNSTPLEKIYHISGFFAKTEYYFETAYPTGFSTIAKEFFVIKKYNKDTKTLYVEPVNFNIKAYIEDIEKKLSDTFNHGEAVSQVLGMLRKKDKMNEYPFIFSTKYNAENYKNELQFYNDPEHNIPRNKDTCFEQLIKATQKNKKDLFFYNKNGFAAIACKDKQMLDYFKNSYINPVKVVNIIETKEHI